MHVVIAILYGGIIWLSVLAYVGITHGAILPILLLAPIIISGAALGIIVLDLMLAACVWLWRNRPGPTAQAKTD